MEININDYFRLFLNGPLHIIIMLLSILIIYILLYHITNRSLFLQLLFHNALFLIVIIFLTIPSINIGLLYDTSHETVEKEGEISSIHAVPGFFALQALANFESDIRYELNSYNLEIDGVYYTIIGKDSVEVGERVTIEYLEHSKCIVSIKIEEE